MRGQSSSVGFLTKLPLVLLVIICGVLVALNESVGIGLNYVDYIALGIIFLAALWGYIKGIIAAIISLVGWIIASICAYVFSEKLANFVLENTKIGEKISNVLDKQIANLGLSAVNSEIDMSQIDSVRELAIENEQFRQLLKENDMLDKLLNGSNSLIPDFSSLPKSLESASDFIVFILLKILCIIVIFLVVKLLISLIGFIINRIASQSSLLTFANKITGTALGLVIGVLIVYLSVTYVIPFIGSLDNEIIPDIINNSYLMTIV